MDLSTVLSVKDAADFVSVVTKSSAIGQIVPADVNIAYQGLGTFYIGLPNFHEHNSGDPQDKIVDETNMVKFVREPTHSYHIEPIDDIAYETNPEIVRAYLRQVAQAAPAAIDRYAFTGKSTGEATNWTGFTGDTVELSAANVRASIYKLIGRGWSEGLGLIFDNTVIEDVADIVAGLQGAGTQNFAVNDGYLLYGVPVYFRNLGTPTTGGEKVVGAVLSGRAFRLSATPLKLIEQDAWSGPKYDNKVKLIADHVIAFNGVQDGAIRFTKAVSA